MPVGIPHLRYRSVNPLLPFPDDKKVCDNVSSGLRHAFCCILIQYNRHGSASFRCLLYMLNSQYWQFTTLPTTTMDAHTTKTDWEFLPKDCMISQPENGILKALGKAKAVARPTTRQLPSSAHLPLAAKLPLQHQRFYLIHTIKRASRSLRSARLSSSWVLASLGPTEAAGPCLQEPLTKPPRFWN